MNGEVFGDGERLLRAFAESGGILESLVIAAELRFADRDAVTGAKLLTDLLVAEFGEPSVELSQLFVGEVLELVWNFLFSHRGRG